MKAFECRMCGECCYGKGGIVVQEADIERIARFLGITSRRFLSGSCEEVNGRIYIKSGPDNFCMYFDKKKGCLIHPVKPVPCSQWPFYDAIVNDRENWEMAMDACPGINPDCSFEAFVEQAGEWEKEKK